MGYIDMNKLPKALGFSIRAMNEWQKYFQEQILDQFDKGKFVNLDAGASDLSVSEKTINHEYMKEDIKKLGLSYFSLRCAWINEHTGDKVVKEGLFVPDMSLETGMELAGKYALKDFIFGEKGVWGVYRIGDFNPTVQGDKMEMMVYHGTDSETSGIIAFQVSTPAPIDSEPVKISRVGILPPQYKQILLRVLACGVCHTDLHIAEGDIPLHLKPITPGHQVVGEVVKVGGSAKRFKVGERVGLAWLAQTCGVCEYCTSGRENLCKKAKFTGYDVDGGFAQYALAHQDYSYRLPEGLSPVQIAPLLCGGIIGYRALRMTGLKSGKRLGLYGFGNSAHIALQVAKHWGYRIYVASRSREHQQMARDLGAVFASAAEEMPKGVLDAAIIFAPAGELVPLALQALDRGGKLILAGIYMSPTPPLDYEKHLYQEKSIQSVANATRRDGEELLALAKEIPIKTEVEEYPFREVNAVLQRLKEGKVRGGAVLVADW
jgi:propanol-preferring alcohol dehydrogenase